MGKIGRGGRSARPDGYFGCPEIKNKKNWPSARSCYGSKSGQLIMKRTLYSTATDRATTDVSINLRQFTITANGHDTRGGSGKAKLKFRPGGIRPERKNGNDWNDGRNCKRNEQSRASLLYIQYFWPKEPLQCSKRSVISHPFRFLSIFITLWK